MKNNVQMVLLCGVFCFFLTGSIHGVKGARTAKLAAAKSMKKSASSGLPAQLKSESGGSDSAATPLAPGEKSKMEIMLQNVTSISYPFRLNVFAGDYCYRQSFTISAPPL